MAELRSLRCFPFLARNFEQSPTRWVLTDDGNAASERTPTGSHFEVYSEEFLQAFDLCRLNSGGGTWFDTCMDIASAIHDYVKRTDPFKVDRQFDCGHLLTQVLLAAEDDGLETGLIQGCCSNCCAALVLQTASTQHAVGAGEHALMIGFDQGRILFEEELIDCPECGVFSPVEFEY